MGLIVNAKLINYLVESRMKENIDNTKNVSISQRFLFEQEISRIDS
jgi:hypothetical protein